MEQQLEQLWQEWQVQRKEMIALIRRIDEFLEQDNTPSNNDASLLGTIAQLINSNQASVAPREKGLSAQADARFIGWYDENGFYFRLSTIRKWIKDLHGVSDHEIYLHLSPFSIRGKTRATHVIRIGEKTIRVLHLKPSAIRLMHSE